MATHMENNYFVPNPALYPFFTAVGIFMLAAGFIFSVNNYSVGNWAMLAGFGLLILMIFLWMGKVIVESEGGAYKQWEDKSFRWGMIVFICSEVAFFAAFFGALFYTRVISVPELAGYDPDFTLYKEFTAAWPSLGPGGEVIRSSGALENYAPNPNFSPMGAWGLPAVNTLILLTSGATITWAHWGLVKNNRSQLVLGMFLTVALGIAFLICQAYEYYHAYNDLGLTLGAGVYGSTFFMLTGFHGFHVTIGTIMLIVIMLRCMKGHFTLERHFGFEGVAWYWHFVDVVWLGLFIFVYWL